MTQALSPNAPLIGQAGSRYRLDTPALLIDLDALERNIAAMAVHARAVSVALRPHAKTHKSVRIARMQVDAGAIGNCCATLGEAEVMVDAGIPGVHITSPQVTPPKIARLIALNLRAHRGLSVVVDYPENLAALDRAALVAGKRLDVLVDFSAGHLRTGCATEADLAALASAAVAAEGLTLRGVQSYSGNLQHIPVRAERRAKALAQLDRLRCMIARLRDGGLEVPIVTGAGTGTFDLDPEARVFTELQVGSYVFMDVDYLRAMREGRNAPPFETALFVATAVVSTNARDYVQQMVISPVLSSRSWVAYRRELYFLLRLQCGSCMTQLAFQQSNESSPSTILRSSASPKIRIWSRWGSAST
jgi:D-serine deaminase-like pyridoxal phosphate-dependent protein